MSGGKPSILVVDDQRGMRLTLTGIFEDHGYEVVGAEDGYRAIEATTRRDFDLILMDINMPGIDGIQTQREIKRIRPDSLVVMMTGYALDEQVKDALADGVYSVISKPLDVEKVFEVMESAQRPVVILVVDDRSTDRESLRLVLADKGYRVSAASSGAEAVEMFRQHHYDVILMDLLMPGKDGFTTFQEIQVIDPDARVIFTTGFAGEDPFREALKSGTYPVASKPVQIAKILALVEDMTTKEAE